ncbi:unnamed protein product [Linum tenue]|uniref:Uncharacterized protein n=1 Tax=Linum tenue TaxID=586396 RepID=A0AAV0R8L1_9ROSI|nr:unnamed protein product [Linum tenue]
MSMNDPAVLPTQQTRAGFDNRSEDKCWNLEVDLMRVLKRKASGFGTERNILCV